VPAVTVDNSAVNTAAYGEYTVRDSSSNAAVEDVRKAMLEPDVAFGEREGGL
jgi:hypothetical protein